ncbi:MAG: helix-turn-helix transcriptional regulator [Chloroflexi bacterium]|nr:helix-turn-helix transcriptional regulator [Chloroflexota bacterium]
MVLVTLRLICRDAGFPCYHLAQGPYPIMATLRELRERNALSQRDLARLAGISVNTVLDLEKSRRRPRPSTRRKLAKALNVAPHEIDFSL